ncbi:beta-lactamase family protein [Streptomyces sp. NBC_01381]|uniref:serine hydrolase domain-containing protein n=1 Tax=Streptomyces sp. NBC_01381 TaxID=2903845 RepID=UPI00224E9698|nr:serine hydrolase domain-containing protein [Streptomyces sp. NBC_01381]MCX4672970.1 beta-lactamase family protein [Streptomyces sp. NBC_01381]
MALTPLTASAVDPAGERELTAKADSFVRGQMKRAGAPGLAYSVIRGDDVVHRRTWGRDGRGEPVTSRTPFLVGSLAKPVTALAVMRQVEAGEVELDAPVRRHLPWFRPKGEGEKPVTVRQLLNQSSGLSERDGITRADRFDNEPGGVRRLARELAGVTLSAPPGERHEYSNANYMLLGALLEEVTGRPFGEQLRKDVLGPLGMKGAITDSGGAERRGLPPGYRFFFGQPRSFASDFDTSGVPYGYLGASPEDMSAFAAAQLKGARGDAGGLLTPEGFREMHKGTISVHDRHRYGLGWRDDELEDPSARMVWHSGATPGYHGIVVLVPERNLAVVVQHNAFAKNKENLLNNTAFGAAGILLGGEPRQVDEDGWLTWALVVLGAVTVALAAVVGWSGFRVVRPRVRSRGGQRRAPGRAMVGGVAAVTGCLPAAGVACFVLPEQMGVTLREVLLFAPDMGRLLVAVAGLGVLLAVLRIVVTVRTVLALRRAGRPVPEPERGLVAAPTAR